MKLFIEIIYFEFENSVIPSICFEINPPQGGFSSSRLGIGQVNLSSALAPQRRLPRRQSSSQ